MVGKTGLKRLFITIYNLLKNKENTHNYLQPFITIYKKITSKCCPNIRQFFKLIMNNCINLKIKLNKTLYCKKRKEIIKISECKFCEYKEYKETQYKELKPKTYKQSKKEKNRYSILYDDMNKCCVENCQTPFYQVELNEVFEGAFRNRSIINGAVCPLCKNHHNMFHIDSSFNIKYKLIFQQYFVKKYSIEWFIKTFGQDYNEKKKKLSKKKDT